MNRILVSCLGLLIAVATSPALAGVTPEELKQLGTTLTPWGAEKAGNADGSIPAYTGGIATMKNLPALSSNGMPADPFADEKPIAKITGQNIDQYKAFLTEGTQKMLARFPDFYLNVYPSHRTAYYPDWVVENTVKNAGKAKLSGDVEGDVVEGAYGMVPFPIPKTGYEVMWNQALRYAIPLTRYRAQSYLVDSSGSISLIADMNLLNVFTYYDKKKTALPEDNPVWHVVKSLYYAPITGAGAENLFWYPLDYSKSESKVWTYTPGQRRTRIAPEFKYDTPIASFGGALNYDEADVVSGRMDRFNYKLIGKKEAILPYNNYKLASYNQKEKYLGSKFSNPDLTRWEKHRVWIVEATLKPGARHVYSKRKFFIDEDTWEILSAEGYDQAGDLYRIFYVHPWQNYAAPLGMISISQLPRTVYDFSKGSYAMTSIFTNPDDFIKNSEDLPPWSELQPASLGKGSAR